MVSYQCLILGFHSGFLWASLTVSCQGFFKVSFRVSFRVSFGILKGLIEGFFWSFMYGFV